MAGAVGSAGDSSGVSQDQLGSLLAYMQDHGAAGVILVGPAGSGKSVIAKAAGNESGIPTIQLDLGAMKGSLVGESESRLRAALKVITSVSNGRSLWIATSNNIAELPPELKRRFNLGTFFFDLPDAEEREAIWQLYAKPYDLIPAQWKKVQHEGWTGAEIRQACDIAQRLGSSLADAAAFVVPVSRSAGEKLEQLRRSAEGRYLSASRAGVYSRTPSELTATRDQPRRRMEVA
jgi:SpoVK/Ycf46/Vps4 family AAA+-type ATPase